MGRGRGRWAVIGYVRARTIEDLGLIISTSNEDRIQLVIDVMMVKILVEREG
jgi:hypothetical protein